ncbi:MAG: hypothetical protein HRU15_10845 [Planctomycetes bacterium]|nr:hypothetical protein [Planctomycetota bacterium]
MSNRDGLGLFKMLVLMVFMAAAMLIGFGIYANWDEDNNGDGQADGFTLRIFDPNWYGIARDDARPLAQNAKGQLLNIREKVMGDGGLLDQGGDVYQQLMQTDAASKKRGGVHTSKKNANKKKILHGDKANIQDGNKKNSWAAGSKAVNDNDPEGAYKFDAKNSSEKPTLHLEDDILQAGEHFAAGKVAYLSAYDRDKNLREDYARHMTTSKEELIKAKELLQPAVTEYAKRPDADPHMQQTSKNLLEAVEKVLADAYVQK